MFGSKMAAVLVLTALTTVVWPCRLDATPSITVTSPVGGETWDAGTTQTVTWTSTDVSGYVYVDLYQGGLYQMFIGYAPVSDRSFSWAICQYVGDGTDFKVVVSGYDALGQTVAGSSAGDFSITGSSPAPPEPTITVTSPSGGESWAAGTTQTITWTSTDPSDYVFIEMFKGGLYYSFIGVGLMSDGEFTWDICPYIGDGTDYTIHIGGQGACGQTVDAFSSGHFAITGSLPTPAATTVRVTSPNGGESWPAGTTHNITWTSTGPLGDVYIDLYEGGAYRMSIAQVPMSDGSFAWAISQSVGSGSNYTVVIRGSDACGQTVQGFSDGNFAITGSLPPPLPPPPPDVTRPTVTITEPTSDPAYTTGDSVLDLGGTASDNVEVREVAWSNDRGGSGTANGKASWAATGILLQTGQNLITVTARDAAGNTATDTLNVTYTPAPVGQPTVTITAPTSDPSCTTDTGALDLAGTVSDAVEVTQLVWSNDRGGHGTCDGTATWTAHGITLEVGQNVITVTARDAAGAAGTAALTVLYSPSAPAEPVGAPPESEPEAGAGGSQAPGPAPVAFSCGAGIADFAGISFVALMAISPRRRRM